MFTKVLLTGVLSVIGVTLLDYFLSIYVDYEPGFVERNNAVRCNCGEYWIDELEAKITK